MTTYSILTIASALLIGFYSGDAGDVEISLSSVDERARRCESSTDLQISVESLVKSWNSSVRKKDEKDEFELSLPAWKDPTTGTETYSHIFDASGRGGGGLRLSVRPDGTVVAVEFFADINDFDAKMVQVVALLRLNDAIGAALSPELPAATLLKWIKEFTLETKLNGQTSRTSTNSCFHLTETQDLTRIRYFFYPANPRF